MFVVRMHVSITNVSKSIELYQFLLHIDIKPSDTDRSNNNSPFAPLSCKNLRMSIYFKVAKNLGTLILVKCCLLLIKFTDLC